MDATLAWNFILCWIVLPPLAEAMLLTVLHLGERVAVPVAPGPQAAPRLTAVAAG